MQDQPSCGRGLAEHSTLPTKMGELIASVAENLEAHMKALDLNDENSRKEHDAYLELSQKHRQIAARLRAKDRKMLTETREAGGGSRPD